MRKTEVNLDTERINRIIELVSSSLLPMLEALAKVTIPLTLASFAYGLIIAVITAIARLSNMKILRWTFGGYVWIFRGTPLLKLNGKFGQILQAQFNGSKARDE